MSKKIKGIIEGELKGQLDGLTGLAVLNPRGLDGNKNNALRKRLHDKGLKMLVVKNTLARRAGAGGPLAGFERLLDGPSAVVYAKGVDVPAIARELADAAKADAKLELRGVFFDGEAFPGPAGVTQVSSFPTREEAIGQVLSAILGPAGAIAGALNQAGMVAGLIAAVEEKAKPAAEAA